MFVMWNCESVSSEQKAVSSWRPFAFNGSSPCDLSDPLCLCGKRSLNNFTTEARRTTERHREISRNRRAFVLLLTAYCLRSEEHTSELQSLAYLVCRLLLEKKKKKQSTS